MFWLQKKKKNHPELVKMPMIEIQGPAFFVNNTVCYVTKQIYKEQCQLIIIIKADY